MGYEEARRLCRSGVNSIVKNLNSRFVLLVGCSLRMSLAPTLINLEYGFSQSRYVALDSLLKGSSGRANGRDGERPFSFHQSERADVMSVSPFSDYRQPIERRSVDVIKRIILANAH